MPAEPTRAYPITKPVVIPWSGDALTAESTVAFLVLASWFEQLF